MEEILIKLCVAILFKFQWQTENSWQRLDSGPGSVSIFTTKNYLFNIKPEKCMKPPSLSKRMESTRKYKVFCELYKLKGHPKMLVN